MHSIPRIKKRGEFSESLFINIWGLVIGGLIILFLLLFGKEMFTQDYMEKQFLSKDITLTIDTLYALPGNAVYRLVTGVINQEDYKSEFGNNYVIVSSNNEARRSYIHKSYYIPTRKIPLRSEIKPGQNMSFVKTNALYVGALGRKLEGDYNLGELLCDSPGKKTSPEELDIVLLLPYTREQYVVNGKDLSEADRLEMEYIKKISTELSVLLQPYARKVSYAYLGDKSAKEGLVIAITVGRYEPYVVPLDDPRYGEKVDVNGIKAYYSSGSSYSGAIRPLACRVINSILLRKGLNFNGAVMVAARRYRDIDLKAMNNGFVLEIANMNSYAGKQMLDSKSSEIASAIFEGIKGYNDE